MLPHTRGEGTAQASPLISVVIAVRNGAATLQRCLDSVFEQEAGIAELVVIDGASTDGTQAIVRRNAANIAFSVSEPDRGIYHAWNKALNHVRGEWVSFLGVDDRLAGPDVLHQAVRMLRSLSTGSRVAYGKARLVGPDGADVGVVGAPWAQLRAGFLRQMNIPHQAVLHRRSLFDLRGRFDETYRICGDYELLLRELIEHEPLFMPDLIVAEMGTSGLSMRSANEALMRREFHRARHAHGLTKTPEGRAPAVIRIEIRDRLRRLLGARAAGLVERLYTATLGRFRRRDD